MNNIINWIASLRGLLVFLVFFSHLPLPLSANLLFVIGRIGVAGFFLVSGFLAKTSLESRSPSRFLWNRFLRLYPIYWLILALTFILNNGCDWKELFWNATLFEEFVGYEAMIQSAWMLPIMVLFFILLSIVEYLLKRNYINLTFFLICVGSVLIGVARYVTGKPFPTALCLLQAVGLLGYMHHLIECKWTKSYIRSLLVFEISLVIASYLSYGDKVLFYFIAYNIGFACFFMFEKGAISIRLFDELGKLGFTFFLGASIPMIALGKIYPGLYSINVTLFSVIEFGLAIVLSYVITNYCEKPLLAWGKKL
jgi:peptidoglycan/LPS O-acetylase OafA/YrhL